MDNFGIANLRHPSIPAGTGIRMPLDNEVTSLLMFRSDGPLPEGFVDLMEQPGTKVVYQLVVDEQVLHHIASGAGFVVNSYGDQVRVMGTNHIIDESMSKLDGIRGYKRRGWAIEEPFGWDFRAAIVSSTVNLNEPFPTTLEKKLGDRVSLSKFDFKLAPGYAREIWGKMPRAGYAGTAMDQALIYGIDRFQRGQELFFIGETPEVKTLCDIALECGGKPIILGGLKDGEFRSEPYTFDYE